MPTIYVELLNEGVDVWRPVQAEPEPEAIFRLPLTAPDGETWRFPPGSRVRCEHRELAGGPALVAIERVSNDNVGISQPGGPLAELSWYAILVNRLLALARRWRSRRSKDASPADG